MEKPIAHTKEDAIALTKMAVKYDTSVMISQNYRYRPEIQAIKKAVTEDLVGKIEYVEWNFQRATKFGGWRDHYEEIIVEDMSIHHFDLMRYLLEKKCHNGLCQKHSSNMELFHGKPTVSITMTFEDVLINYFASWVTSGPETSWNGDFKLYGEKGIIALSMTNQYEYKKIT